MWTDRRAKIVFLPVYTKILFVVHLLSKLKCWKPDNSHVKRLWSFYEFIILVCFAYIVWFLLYGSIQLSWSKDWLVISSVLI